MGMNQFTPIAYLLTARLFMLLQTSYDLIYVQNGGKASRVQQSRFFSLMILSIYNIISMFKQKLSDLFLRKENKKEEPRPIPTFDQSFFDCQLITKGLNTELIRVQTRQKAKGEPLDQIRCRWYLKSKVDFKQIEDVTSEYYQPCLDDVGTLICVQVDPAIEGRKYTGITIMIESPPIKLDPKLQQHLEQYISQREVTFTARIEAVFSQNPKYEEYEFPLEVKLELKGNSIALTKDGKQLERIQISQEYPNIEFIRKSFSSILFNFNERESMKLGLSNNFDRDLFALIIRTCAVQPLPPPCPETKEETLQSTVNSFHSLKEEEDTESLPPEQETMRQAKSSCESLQLEKRSHGSGKGQKVSKSSNSSTMLVLKLEEQSKEIKLWKRKFQELQHDYHLEKQSKNEVQCQIKELKQDFQELKKHHQDALSIAEKVKKISEDNRFYKNQISIKKKELKNSNQKIAKLEQELADQGGKAQEQYEKKLLQARQELECILQEKNMALKAREDAIVASESLKETTQALQNENQGLHRKLSTMAKEKHIKQIVESPTKLSTSKAEESERVKELQMKLKNLEMLLRYRSGQGEVSSNFQMLVANLTQTVTEKELQIVDLRKVNKNLLQQLQAIKSDRE